MGVREDCRHYVQRSTQVGDTLQRCKLSAAEEDPFACPAACLFFERRVLSTAGWTTAPGEPMSNTAWGLAKLSPAHPRATPPAKATKGKKRGRRGR
jgi:hypothetical protein